MKKVFKNHRVNNEFTEFCLFDTEKKVQSEIELGTNDIETFCRNYGFEPISPIEAKNDGLLDYNEVSLIDFLK